MDCYMYKMLYTTLLVIANQISNRYVKNKQKELKYITKENQEIKKRNDQRKTIKRTTKQVTKWQ